MKISIILLLVLLQTNVAKGVWDIRDFGAKGDGKTLDTEAIQTAIDECFPVGLLGRSTCISYCFGR